MTLLRQLIIAVVILFATLYAVNTVVSVDNNRGLVGEQMKVHAQDTANSLGFSMAHAAAGNDQATLQAVLDAVSDSGYFKRMVFRDQSGEILAERHFPQKTNGAPDWFVDAVALPAYQVSAQIIAGSAQLGTLTVESHPAKAYQKLWQLTVTQLTWFAVVTALVCVFAGMALRWLVGPLQRLEAQANAIVDGRFELQTELPSARELKTAVQAMNRMSSRLKSLFNEQVALIGRLREQATHDPVTGLCNRAEFDAQLASVVTPEGGPRAGMLFIIRLDDLQGINDYAGRTEGNAVLASVGQAITDAIKSPEGGIVARRQGAEIAVFLPDVEISEAEQLAATTFDEVKRLTWQHSDRWPLVFSMGFTHSEAMETPRNLLGEADVALKKAQSAGANQWCKFADVTLDEPPVISKPIAAWRDYLEPCIAEREIELHLQPVVSVVDKKPLATEAFVRFHSDNGLMPAGVVLPAAEKLGLMPALEQLIVETAIQKMQDSDSDFILNLSSASICSERFMAWLDDTLKATDNASRLYFEVSERSLQTSVTQIEALNNLLFKQGSKLGIDHFGLNTSSFSYLSRLSLAYLKVHRSFVAGLLNNPDNQFYIQMLGNLAKSLEIQIWVEGVETQEDFDVLASLGADAAQGYFLGAPE